MRRITKVLLLVAAVLIAGAVGLSVWLPLRQSGATQKIGIVQLVAQADRIVLDPNVFPGRAKLKPTTTVTGRAAVEELLARIEFEPAFIRGHCMCIGEVAFRFCENEREVLALTLHHGQSLRVLDAKWARNMNMPLTANSRDAVAAWLRLNGYTPETATSSAPE